VSLGIARGLLEMALDVRKHRGPEPFVERRVAVRGKRNGRLKEDQKRSIGRKGTRHRGVVGERSLTTMQKLT